jgi:hypothetical protein
VSACHSAQCGSADHWFGSRVVQEGGVSGVARVIRELRARIVASHHRAELLTQAAAEYPGMQWSVHDPAVAVPLNGASFPSRRLEALRPRRQNLGTQR